MREMTEVNFYRWSAILPIVLPLFAHVVAWHTSPPRGMLDGVATLVVVAGVAGGPAYVPFISVLLCLLRKRPISAYRIASFVAPLLFIPVFVLYLFLFGYIVQTSEPFWPTALFYMPYLLVVGFAYVGLIHLLRLVLSRCGWVSGGERDAV
jgi:hypothetical protein